MKDSCLIHDELNTAASYHFCLVASMQRHPDLLDGPVSITDKTKLSLIGRLGVGVCANVGIANDRLID